MSKAYFWSLLITSHLASVCLWSRDGETTSVEVFGPEVLWEKEDELVSAVDTSLTEISSQMPEDAGEPAKTVFGVMSSWVTDGHIQREYLTLIREICEKLSLEAVGFVVVPEAISHEVKQNEGGPLSSVLVGVTRDKLEVTLFRLGTLAGTIEVGRSMSLTEDLIEALSRFQSHDSLPSRFIVFGAGNEELLDITHLLSSVNWKQTNEKLQFLHEPKIELAGTDRVLGAISLAGSSEMGPVVSFNTPEEMRPPEKEDLNVVATDVSLNDLGFAMNADITKITPKDNAGSPVSEEPVSEDTENTSMLHTVQRSPMNRIKHAAKGLSLVFARRKRIATLPVENHVHTPQHPRVRRRISLPQFLGLVGLVLALLIGGSSAAWYYLPKAEITIFISPRTLTSRQTFTLSGSTESIDIDNKILPVKVYTKTVSLDTSAPASGTKTVGDKAKGSVTIRNGTANNVSLPTGALIVGPNDVQFTIDQSASVSAATSPASPGTATVPATALVIGPDSNLSQDQTLKVGKFLQSEIDAIVSTAFTGGSSRQITAVSKADLDALEKDTLSKLVAQANQEISGEVPDDHVFIADSVKTKTNSKVFNHKVGDEAATINLSMEVEATAYAMPKSAITEAAQKLLESQVPSGYSFRPEQVETSFDVQTGATTLAADVGFTAHLLPNLNPDDIARAVAGKRFQSANDYLATIPGFVRAAITSHPALPDAIRFVPFMAKHIAVSVEAEK